MVKKGKQNWFEYIQAQSFVVDAYAMALAVGGQQNLKKS